MFRNWNFWGVAAWLFAIQVIGATTDLSVSAFSRQGMIDLTTAFLLFCVAFFFWGQIVRNADQGMKFALLVLLLMTSFMLSCRLATMISGDLSLQDPLVFIGAVAHLLGFCAVMAISSLLASRWQRSDEQLNC